VTDIVAQLSQGSIAQAHKIGWPECIYEVVRYTELITMLR
jgi:hypothetical protein